MGPMATASESARLCVPNKYAVTATRANPSRLPVRTPATMVSPPRISGLSTARVRTRSAGKTGDDCVGFSGPRASTLRLGRGREGLASGGQGGFVVGMVGHFLDVFGVADLVVLVKHEYGATLDAQLLDERPVVRTE